MGTATTEKTGADLAADALTAKLEAAGWEVRTLRGLSKRTEYSDGRLMLPVWYNVSLFADGPRAIGTPYLTAYWSTITEPAVHTTDPAGTTSFGPAQLGIGDVTRELTTETEMHAWLDALIAVAAALAA